jgi:uncharacterized protein YndB with AHSA1/START domain
MAEQATQTTIIAAPLDTVWSIATDIERYPEWAKDVKEVAIRERDDQGRPAEVEVRQVPANGLLRLREDALKPRPQGPRRRRAAGRGRRRRGRPPSSRAIEEALGAPKASAASSVTLPSV